MAYVGNTNAGLAWVERTASPRDRAASMVIRLVARERRVHEKLLLRPERGRTREVRARQLAMYLTHVMLGRSLADVGRQFGRNASTVSHACAKIEDMRDNPRFEAEVSRLEAIIEAVRESEADEC